MTAALLKAKSRTHGELKREVMKACNRLPGVFLFPAGSGGFRTKYGFARFGMVGVSDLIGWRTQPKIMEKTASSFTVDWTYPYPVFVALEIKVGKDKLSPEQAAFLDKVRAAGGIAREIRSVEQAVDALL